MVKGMIIGVLVAVGVVAVGVGLYAGAASVQKAGVVLEQGLNAQYQDDQLVLDTGVKEIIESMNIANVKTDKLDQVLKDAVSGRYTSGSSADVGHGQLFSAIQEAYPNVDVSVYNQIIDKEFAFRERFLNSQTGFIDRLRDYDTWRTEGLLKPMFVRMMGFPSQNLTARIGTTTLHGAAAEDQMHILVTSSATDDAFKTGHEDPIEMPKN